MKKKSLKNVKFEDAVEQLESIIDQVESGEIGLEEALARYEEGMNLITHCRGILSSAEKKIASLSVADEEVVAEEDEKGEWEEEVEYEEED